MKFRCLNPACAVGMVTVEPKDKGAGSDLDDLRDLASSDSDALCCPVCETVMREQE